MALQAYSCLVGQECGAGGWVGRHACTPLGSPLFIMHGRLDQLMHVTAAAQEM